MSQHCKPQQKTLVELGGKLLEFTPKFGLMRCLQPKEDPERARAVYFMCPRCEKQHGITLMFKLADVDAKAPPLARFRVKKHPAPLEELSLLDRVKVLACGVEGYIQNGVFHYRYTRS